MYGWQTQAWPIGSVEQFSYQFGNCWVVATTGASTLLLGQRSDAMIGVAESRRRGVDGNTIRDNRACCWWTTIWTHAKCTRRTWNTQVLRWFRRQNGVEALREALKSRPDIILMDLSLPVMDGWEATRQLKADPRTANIPVVALTGQSLRNANGAKEVGCEAFLTKPCLPKTSSRKSAGS